MSARTKLGLSAVAALVVAGGIATINDTGRDEHGIHYMAGWAPKNVRTVSAQWGVRGDVRSMKAATSPFDKKSTGHRGDVAFTFIKLPPNSHQIGSFWCSVTTHGETKTVNASGDECYVAVQV